MPHVQLCVSFSPFSMLLMYHGKMVMWGSTWSHDEVRLGSVLVQKKEIQVNLKTAQ